MQPAFRALLWDGAIVPVICAAGEQRPFQWICDVRIAWLAAGFHQRDRQRRILAKPRRDDRTGRARANDDDVKFGDRLQADAVPASRARICACTIMR